MMSFNRLELSCYQNKLCLAAEHGTERERWIKRKRDRKSEAERSQKAQNIKPVYANGFICTDVMHIHTGTHTGTEHVDSCRTSGAKVLANTFRRKKLKRASKTMRNIFFSFL